MKALIIAEDDDVINSISSVLKNKGFEVITYRWLLKALDNVEEIAPHLAVISTREYPRHWKTFVQFTQSSIGGIIPKIILYNSLELSSDEMEKAKALGISGSFSSLQQEGLSKLSNILDTCFNESDESVSTNHELPCMFTNPNSGQLVSGKIHELSGESIHFKPDLPEKYLSLPINSIVSFLYLDEEKSIKKVNAKITGLGKYISLKVENGF